VPLSAMVCEAEGLASSALSVKTAELESTRALRLEADAEIAACSRSQREAGRTVRRGARSRNLDKIRSGNHEAGIHGIQRQIADVLACHRLRAVATGAAHSCGSEGQRRGGYAHFPAREFPLSAM
jgi:hypothetical protein